MLSTKNWWFKKLHVRYPSPQSDNFLSKLYRLWLFLFGQKHGPSALKYCNAVLFQADNTVMIALI